MCNDLGVELDGTGRDRSVAAAIAQVIRDAGGDAIADTSDISTFAGAAASVEAGRVAYGFVDIVVNNAGTAMSASLGDVTEDLLLGQYAVHLIGAIGTAKAAWPMMVERGWGRVVNTVSEAAFPDRLAGGAGGAGGVGYGSAKAAVWAATFALAAEGASRGITVNAVSPGARTRMNERLLEAAARPLDLDPMHVARVVAWLVSPDAADVTGRVIHAAAGRHREYRMDRFRDTALTKRLDAVIAEEAH